MKCPFQGKKSWQTENFLFYKVLTCRKECFGGEDTTFSPGPSTTHTVARGWQPQGAAKGLGGVLKGGGLAASPGDGRGARDVAHPAIQTAPWSVPTLG